MSALCFHRAARCRSLVATLACAGCALDPGHGFATVESARLEVRLEPGEARDLGGDAVLSDLGYHVSLDSATLTIARVELQELRGGAGSSATFDPAHPPPGYTLCHGGHCHADDGRLVDYAEIEAELGGGAASFASVVGFAHGEPADLLDGGSTELGAAEPSRELPRARLRKVRARLAAVRLAGVVAEGPAGGGFGDPVPLTVDLALEESCEAGIDVPIDRDGPGAIAVRIGVTVGGRVFDGIDFAAEAGGAVEITATEHPLAPLLIGSLVESEVSLHID
jgi:hypothetical protein